MNQTRFDASHCFMTKFSSLVAGKWKPLILYLIEHEVNRFNQMLDHLPTISRKILTDQLRGLEEDGLIVRTELKSKVPKVVIYRLSNKGIALRDLIDQIIAWGIKHMESEVPEEMKVQFVSPDPKE